MASGFAGAASESEAREGFFGEAVTATTDEQIVEQALGGEPEAFGELVRRWERKIFSLSYG
ncbi:MAG: hypothetical protein H0T60_15490, partial [Acidobacteria bacterium]|nr:hypothetical protein [Acidobacteriota bacterium]